MIVNRLVLTGPGLINRRVVLQTWVRRLGTKGTEEAEEQTRPQLDLD